MKTGAIKTFLAGSIFAGSSIFVSCNYDSAKGLHDYMAERGDKQEQLDSVLSATSSAVSTLKEAYVRQSTLDSMAYRDLFNQTQLANDSSAVAEFNKIASKYKLADNYYEGMGSERRFFEKALSKDGADIKTVDSLIEQFPSIGFLNVGNDFVRKQYFGDRYFYQEFFKGKNLLPKDNEGTKEQNDFKQKFVDVSEKIAP